MLSRICIFECRIHTVCNYIFGNKDQRYRETLLNEMCLLAEEFADELILESAPAGV